METELLSVKEEVRRMLDRMPDDITFDDVMDELFLRIQVERALQDAREGRVVSQEEMERQFRLGA